MNPQVLTTMTSAASGLATKVKPDRFRTPSMTSLSTRFLAHPRLIRATLGMSGPAPVDGTAASGVDPVKQAREGDGLPDVLDAADPGHGPLEPQAEARVRHGPVLPQVDVPLVGIAGEIVLLDALFEEDG